MDKPLPVTAQGTQTCSLLNLHFDTLLPLTPITFSFSETLNPLFKCFPLNEKMFRQLQQFHLI